MAGIYLHEHEHVEGFSLKKLLIDDLGTSFDMPQPTAMRIHRFYIINKQQFNFLTVEFSTASY